MSRSSITAGLTRRVAILSTLALALSSVHVAARPAAANTGDPGTERVKRGIHLSINGIAAGLRNTG